MKTAKSKERDVVEHTPTPWSWQDASPTVVLDGSFHAIAECFKENKNANAAFIVRAVNCHQELVWQLKSAQAWLERASLLLTPDQRGSCGFHSTDAAHKAIAKAEGAI